MKKTNKFIKVFLVTSILLLSMYVIPSHALDNNVITRAVERYTKSVNISCDDYGYVTVNAIISHNMTTGRFTLDSVGTETHFFSHWAGSVFLNGVKTNPKIGEIITGKSIKVTITYVKFGLASYTKTGYIYL